MRVTHFVIPSIAAITIVLPAFAGETVTFDVIPNNAFTAMDMSPDGRYVVGSAPAGPYLWDRETGVMTILPAPGTNAVAVSDFGDVVLGSMPDPDGDGGPVAGIWTADTGWFSLGYLPNALNCPSQSSPYELSKDGSVATGLSWDGCSGRGFVWTAETGMVELEPLANGGNRSSVVSADGTKFAGFAQGSGSRTPARWGADTSGELFDPPNGDMVGEVKGISDDGGTMLLQWGGDAVRWTESGGIQIIDNGALIGTWVGNPTDIADDGTIVGYDSFLGATRAWIAPNGFNMTSLDQWLIGHGVTPSISLGVCDSISKDGDVIVGHTSFVGAWIVTIENDVCLADINDDGVVDVDDMLTVLGGWGTDGPGADIAEPIDVIDVSDLLGVLGAWGPCP